MTKKLLLEYLKEHGEQKASSIQIPNLTTKTINSMLSKLFALNEVDRRQVVESETKSVWAYRLINTLPIEPDYSYILRNLPRNENAATDSY